METKRLGKRARRKIQAIRNVLSGEMVEWCWGGIGVEG
jgi:hypothetical protein